MMEFKEFLTTDLAHADVFNNKVRDPGEALRSAFNQHKADKDNPHEVTWDQIKVDAEHGNELHNPDFITEDDIQDFAKNADLQEHTQKTTNDGVHGFRERQYMSKESKTYYIDQANGDDGNDGLSSASAFKTWGKVESLLPIFISHNYIITIIGDYEGDINLDHRTVSGAVEIGGYTGTPSEQVIDGDIEIVNCPSSDVVAIRLRNLRVTGKIYASGNTGLYVISCEPRYPTDDAGAIRCRGMCVVRVEDCDFGDGIVETAIRGVPNGHHIYSINNRGNAKKYGLYTSAGIIAKHGDQPTGGVSNEHSIRGGRIFG